MVNNTILYFIVLKSGHSGILVGRGHKVEATAVEVNGCYEVIFVAETACRVLNPLNL